ncbi:Polygalacturonase [Paenibacillus sp. UNCCL117]|uniref:S-layer homology domain-containing protein n=1 Tax=unclassified Paenibacillus TaxID=185978 RepID=UPI00087FFC80|nr:MULTISPECIES: S-layer homology domain-containing protein [unclassified Paenibacillus]SDD83717.1 Polygalacturonase [Paenibacillus sp. cl123]SFW54796.1 Polygalacturonase [Paenibacillus sp. UNCCL117]
MLTRKVMSLLLALVVAISGFIPQAASATDVIQYVDSASPAALPQAAAGPAVIQNYPMPSIYTASEVFTLKADNEAVPVINYLPYYDYAQFSFAGTVTIEVTANKPITSYSISPLAKNIKGTVDGNKLTFTLSASTYVIVDINPDPKENPDEKDPAKIRKRLVIAADPLETDIPASSGPGIYNVMEAPYNADNTGASITSAAIQRAIDDAHQAGGGIVYIPAGVYTSSNLTLKSNVTFYLAGGAVIVGTGRGEDYRNDFRKDSISDGTYFIMTEINSENITMRGRGTIDGKGIEMRKRKMTDPPATHKKGEGFINNLLVPMATSNFTFDGLILRDGGFWAFMVVRSDNVKITNYKGFQDLHTLEDDAIDINESQNVLVKHAIAISDDDAYSTKTWPQKGMSKNWPGAIEHLENVIFEDCMAWTRCAAFKLGMGICTPQIGVTIRNSYVYQSARALLVDHAYTENPLPEEGWARDITFENIDIERVGINQFGNYWLRISTSTSGDVSNVVVKNINVRDTGGGTSVIQGNSVRGGMINGVTFSDVYIKGKLAASLSDLKASANSYTNTIIFANTKPPLFSDDFETGDSTKWTTATGTWTVVADGTNVLAQKANNTTGLIMAGDSWTNYGVEARVKMPITNANAGVLFRVADAENYYMYRINSSAKKLELYKAINGTLTAVSSTPFTAAANQWYTVKAVVEGNTIKGYVDGELKTEWTNPVTELTAGKIGFRTTTLNAVFDDVVVSAINGAPADIALSPDSIAENTTAGGVVGKLSTTDSDAGDTFYYSLAKGEGDTDNKSFSLLGDTLILGVTPDYETKNSYSIRVRTTDSGGLSYEKIFTIHILDLDETPVYSNPNAILFGDDFETGTTANWASTGGTWNVAAEDTKVLVQKSSTTALLTAGTSWTDYAYEAKVRVPITNANAGLVFRVQDSKNFYMYRINVAAQKLELYKSVDGVMTSVSSTPFTAVSKRWYTLKAIVQGNTIQGYVDGERAMVWTNPVTELTAGKIGFRTTSADAAFDQALVTALNKAPADISLTNASVSELAAVGSSVGTLSTTDPDEGDTFTYSLAAGDGDSGNASFAISGNTLQTAAAFVYDTQNSYSIRIRSMDSGGLSVEKQFTIAVTKADAHLADASNNTATLDRTRVAAGDTVTITAAGDRQTADGLAAGDEKFIPTTWSSTESGKNGSFMWNAEEEAYTSSYTASEAGTHLVTAAFQKQSWNGSSWVGGATDTKTVTLDVYAPVNPEGNSLSVSPGSAVVGQTVVITAEGYNQNVTPSIIGDERYYPLAWSSTEAGKSGVFTVTGQVYQAAYIPAQAGDFQITATYQKQVWDGTAWTDTTTDTLTAALTVSLAPAANAEGNTLELNAASITAGGTVVITAAGDRQHAAGTILGEERYYPVAWSSTEAGKSGVFTVNGQTYSSNYTTSAAGQYIITATFQKQSWDGTAWIDGTTDTKTVSLTVNAQSTGGNDDPDEEESSPSPSSSPTPSPGAGNPGAGTPADGVGAAVTTQEGGQTVTTVAIDSGKLEQQLAQGGNGATVIIPVNTPSDKVVVELTGRMMKSLESKNALLQVKTDQVTYTLPAAQLNLDAVSKQIGTQTELNDITIQLTIAAPAANTVKQVQDTAGREGYQLVAQPVEFKITATSGSKTVEVSTFNGYVERTIALPDGTDSSKVMTGIVLNADGTFSHVPTKITVIAGKMYAKINSLTNSTYSVISSPKTFADVNTHWAREAVNDMGSKLVVDGSGDGRFEPDRDITRAEFAAIIVKGLGLMRPGTGKDVFKDVAQDSWYYDAAAIAYEYGLIEGYEDGTFGPMDKITREQAMTMTARAMKLTGLKAELTQEEADKLLAGFEDAGYAADYAKPGIASVLNTGIITGRDGHIMAPKSNITRAEVAVIVSRLLQKSGLI